MPPAAFNILGLVRIIERQVEKLRAHPDWTQIIAEEFQVIPPQPGSVDPSALDPGGRYRILAQDPGEIVIDLRFRGIAGLTDVHGVRVSVERGDGKWENLTTTQRASFIDSHVLGPKACVWNYRFSFVNQRGAIIGKTSAVSVAVPAAA